MLSVGSSLVSLPITTTLSVSSSLSVKVMTSSFLRQDNCEYKYNQILQVFYKPLLFGGCSQEGSENDDMHETLCFFTLNDLPAVYYYTLVAVLHTTQSSQMHTFASLNSAETPTC